MVDSPHHTVDDDTEMKQMPDLCEEVIDHIRAGHIGFNINDWVAVRAPDHPHTLEEVELSPDCETTACLAAHIVLTRHTLAAAIKQINVTSDWGTLALDNWKAAYPKGDWKRLEAAFDPDGWNGVLYLAELETLLRQLAGKEPFEPIRNLIYDDEFPYGAVEDRRVR